MEKDKFPRAVRCTSRADDGHWNRFRAVDLPKPIAVGAGYTFLSSLTWGVEFYCEECGAASENG
jgi:hypothetical protein